MEEVISSNNEDNTMAADSTITSDISADTETTHTTATGIIGTIDR